MHQMDDSFIKQLNEIGFRDSFGKAIMDVGDCRPDVVVLAADLSDACRLTEFSKRHPERFIQVGIAEQNMVGIAAGLALNGLTAFAPTFATFVSLRCCEQVRTDVAYQRLNVKMVGIDSGVAVGTLGSTHYALEDIGVFRSIPNMVILNPADGMETYKAVWAAAQYDGPVYLRLAGGKNLEAVYQKDYPFEIGKAIALREGDEVSIIATGLMVSRALRTAVLLGQDGIDARVINMHTIKPVDRDAVLRAATETKLVVTVEEHNRIGGLGSAVAEVMAELKNHAPLFRLGLPDEFPHIGSHEEILARYGLTEAGIAREILEKLK